MNESLVMFARQPILGADGGLHAYEFLHRGPLGDGGEKTAVQSARIICETLGLIGLDRLSPNVRTFLGFDQELLEAELPPIFMPDRSVVEIRDNVQPLPPVFAAIEKFRRNGALIAIDNFLGQTNLLPLLVHADYVKIDLSKAGDDLQSVMAGLSQYRLHLLAESVETREQFAACKALGFEYFQGNFFARPEPMAKRCLAPMELCVLTLVARLQNPQTCSDAVADAISVDVSLAHQILRIANSSAYYRGRDVTSILEAVVMLGHNVIRQWASLLLLSRLGVHKPSELLKIAVTRARLCQTLGSTHQELCCHELFTAGLLSVLDALFDQPMDDVLADLPLAASLKEALCGRPSGVLGEILRCAIDYGSGAWADAAVGDSSGQRIDMDTYLDAVEFADRALDVSG